MPKFRKKPVVIEAMQFDGSWEGAQPILQWIEDHKLLDQAGPTWSDSRDGQSEPLLYIHTLEGTMAAGPGDWVIRGVAGEFYPCKPDIFGATYEPAE
jgi:hypothetical protein